jgi:hypothetical protein
MKEKKRKKENGEGTGTTITRVPEGEHNTPHLQHEAGQIFESRK